MNFVFAAFIGLFALQQSAIGANGCRTHPTADLPEDNSGDICSGQAFQRDALCSAAAVEAVAAPAMEVIPLVVSGRSDNRADLVFFGDGYTLSERAKFIADAQMLADDMTKNQTFYTVQPLMNFWAAFTPSNESGVGVGGRPKDTVYGLYREGTELRGLYYSKASVAQAACTSLGTQCDYPILLGNDPYYGGLGGRFTTVTASPLNGAIVLRHELGHSIINIGEEYDGGSAYSGVNSLRNPNGAISWAHWLTNTTQRDSSARQGGKEDGEASQLLAPRVERSVMPIQRYVWSLLNTTSPWSTTFQSSGLYSRYQFMFSLSNIPRREALRVEIDGVEVDWTPRPNVGMDRWHYQVFRNQGLKGGRHEIKFTLRDASLMPRAQLCNLEIVEYGTEAEFVTTQGHYSLYPTHNSANATTYRPTNEDCLMRKMVSPNLCKVCLEGLWLSLLRNLNIIDNFAESCIVKNSRPYKVLEATLLPLAQFRTNEGGMRAFGLDESYTITWRKNGQVLTQFANLNKIEVDGASAVGSYTVDVKFATSEVRLTSTALSASRAYNVTRACT